MTNIEIAGANMLRLRAERTVSGMLIPNTVKTVVREAIDRVTLPLHRYYKSTADEIKKSFISLVLGGVKATVDKKYKEKILKCLALNL